MTVDVLAIGAHPDDIELACGGTVALLVKQGYKVALADATQGELGTRGSKEIRSKEADEAANILGVITRRNLRLADGQIDVSERNIKKLIVLIRELQPRLLLIPHSTERHPDHVHTHQLCKEAWFYSGLSKIHSKHAGIPQRPFRPDIFFEFMQWYHFEPSFVVDVSDTFDTKMRAIRAHSSQFHNPKSKEPETKLSTPEFLERVETEARFYGHRIGAEYGEAFFCYAPVGVGNLFHILTHKK
ncbi:MAG TPA: bacillithiol biosynthesis deacetylase BshB1 [Bacteroidetes bacterium]|nr:bacillithiol biosynthesis deacetylase BshB1 [Bacteroidota bacterium]